MSSNTMPTPHPSPQQQQPLTRRVTAWIQHQVVQVRLRIHHARIDADMRHHLAESDYYAELGVHAQWAREWHAKEAAELLQRSTRVQALRKQLRAGGGNTAAAPIHPTAL